MYKLSFCLLLLVYSMHAASISDDETYSVYVSVGPPEGSYASQSDELQGLFTFTVTGGLDQGYFSPCLEVMQDYFQGTANATASFGAVTLSMAGRGFVQSCYPNGSTYSIFTLGEPQVFEMLLSAFASAGSDYSSSAQATASASLTGFQFLDSSMNPVSGVTYSLVEDVPEPAVAIPLVCGLLILAGMRLLSEPLTSRAHRPD